MSSSRNSLSPLKRVVGQRNGHAPLAGSAKVEARSSPSQQDESEPVLFSDSDVMPLDIVGEVIIVSDSDDERGDSSAQQSAQDFVVALSPLEQRPSPQQAQEPQPQRQSAAAASPLTAPASSSSSSSSSSSVQPANSSPLVTAAASSPLSSSSSSPPQPPPAPPHASVAQSPAAAAARSAVQAASDVSQWRTGGVRGVHASEPEPASTALTASAPSSSLSNGKRTVAQLASAPSSAPAAKWSAVASDGAGDGSDTEDDEMPSLVTPPARLTDGLPVRAAAAPQAAAPQAAAPAAHRPTLLDSDPQVSDPHRRQMNGLSTTAPRASVSAPSPASSGPLGSPPQPSAPSLSRASATTASPAAAAARLPNASAAVQLAAASAGKVLLPSFLTSLIGCSSSAPSRFCFSCQCPIVELVGPSCSVCYARYHPSCCTACPRHQCCLCAQPPLPAASASLSLYHCLLCPRSFCFRHATAAASAFSSLPSLPSMSRFGPALISLLVAHALRSQDSVAFYTALPRAQLGICQECAAEVEEEEAWRAMQGKRRWRRIVREQAVGSSTAAAGAPQRS